jgi:hypothetical protein
MSGKRHFAMAGLAYAGLSYLLLAHGAPLTRSILGTTSDPLTFIWFLAWWPHALLHHLNPLHALLIWQPAGLDLVWTTSVPVLALLMIPVTLGWGPMLSYNLLTLAAPVLAALAAEIVREQIFLQTRDEVPYGATVETESFKEQGTKIRIDAVIYVSRPGHKGILIGAKGGRIRATGLTDTKA